MDARTRKPGWSSVWGRVAACGLTTLLLLIGGVPGKEQTAAARAQSVARPYAGATITVVLPPWGAMPAARLRAFTQQTGINVNLQILGWDQIHDKVVTAVAAGVSPGDVTEFDWSWVGQFARGGWYTPLNGYINKALVADIPATPLFSSQGNTLAIPYSADFRFLLVNTQYFRRAGITTLPRTMADVLADARQIKAKKVATYPLALPLSATEGAATPWYLFTKAFGGDLFSRTGQPLFTARGSAGALALGFIATALKTDAVIDPAEVALTDVQSDTAFRAGRYAMEFVGPGTLATANDPKQSKVAGQVHAVLMPGLRGPSQTIGLPEALGIPKASKNPGAAAAFITWWLQPANLTVMYQTQGDLPTRTSVISAMVKGKSLFDGETVLRQSTLVAPIFPQGTPTWYPRFSTEVATTINALARGSESVDQALQHLGSVAQGFGQ